MTDQPVAESQRPNLKERAVEELKAFLYITLYFWLLFSVFDLYRLSLRSEGVSLLQNGFNIINALVLAKVALVTEALYKRRQMRDVRLAYRVLSHSLVLTVVLIAFGILEEAIRALVHGEAIGTQLNAAHFGFILGKAAVFFIMLIPFCAVQELAQLLGAGPLRDVFFGSPAGKRYALVTESKPSAGTPSSQ